MLIEKGDTVLFIVYHAPSLKGFDIGKITSKEVIHKKKFYEIDNSHNLYRQDQIILKLTEEQIRRLDLINRGPTINSISKPLEL